MRSFPETIIEIYDEEQIYNVLAVCEFKPKNVVYIGTRKLKNKRIKNNIISCLRSLGLTTKCFFYSTDMLSINSVISELENILSIFGECAIDLTGGNEVALVAVGMLAKERGIPLFRYDRYAQMYRNIYECEAAADVVSEPKFNINAVLALAGGAMKSHGHVSVDGLDKDTSDDIFRTWTIYKKYHRVWSRTVSYLQQISKDLEGEQLHIDASAVIYGGDRISGADKAVMNELCESGLIRNYKNDGKRISFDYKNPLIRSCLCDIGVCLELYVYAAAISAGVYDDVQISVVIDWDGDLNARINTINEIDVMLTRGAVPVFISCKSGSVNTTTLNEIKTLTTQFGGVLARPVLVTMANVRTADKHLLQRAVDMGIDIIDRNDLLHERLSKRLYALSKL
ncbi:MAG: DUF1887 family protein [Clostridia bacterium]|nr:DUF1887 family protein [Clostridia bacterium]